MQKAILHFIFPICLKLGLHLVHEKNQNTVSLCIFEKKRIFVVELILIMFSQICICGCAALTEICKIPTIKDFNSGKEMGLAIP